MEANIIFNRVEIEINTHCNRKKDAGAYCKYCPNSIIEPLKPAFIKDRLYKKIINELCALKFSGRISFHFYGEPLLHPKIEKLIEYTRHSIIDSELVLYTNGDRLDEAKYNCLIASGINKIIIFNTHKKFPNRPNQIILRQICFTNRGGTMAKCKTLKEKCFAPTHRLVIGYNGDILLCYEDAKRQNGFGNLNDNKIEEIWFSNKFVHVRKNLQNGRRDLHEPCRYCNNNKHTKIGDINVNKFI